MPNYGGIVFFPALGFWGLLWLVAWLLQRPEAKRYFAARLARIDDWWGWYELEGERPASLVEWKARYRDGQPTRTNKYYVTT